MTDKIRKAILPILVLVLSAPVAKAQQTDPSILTLERIYSSSDFLGDQFGPARWLEDGSGYTTVEASETIDGGQDIIRYNPASGDRQVMVSASDLIPDGSDQPLPIHNYSWSPDGTKALIFTNSVRVWRDNTRGDYWILDTQTNRLNQIGTFATPSTLMFAKISPDGEKVGYVTENNVYVEALSDGSVTQLTHDGSKTIINGTTDWVNEEEFFLRDAFRWSPDSEKIAYWRLDTEGIGEFLMINNTDSIYSYVIPVQYPKAGTTNSDIRIGVVSARGGETTWVIDDDDPRNHYLPRMDWADNSEELIIQHMNRLQNTNEVRLANAETGRTRTLMIDRDDAWLDAVDDLIWTDDSQHFTWVSERDGWRHAYLVDRDSGEMALITDGDYDVMNIVRIDIEGGWLYFIGSFEDAAKRYLYRVAIDGGAPERLTPANKSGWNSYQVSADARWAIHSHSSFHEPTTIDLVSLPDHRIVKNLLSNDRLQGSLDALTLGELSFFKLDLEDDVVLDGWMIKPSHFDPEKQYPVLFFVYGEPWNQTVVDRFGGSQMLWHHMIAEQGYLVISIDNRGTPAPRGRAWRKIIYGNIGTLASIDQAAALKKISEWPYVDSSRIGIWGWSGGGSMTLNMMFRYPELYHVGMSVAPVPDQRLYDTIYQERYMGLPQENVEGYREGSPITHAEGLKGDLLIVHGTGDDNVHYQGTERLINKLIENNLPFEMMAYPNRSHGIFEGAGTSRHLRELLTKFLYEHLESGGRLSAAQPEG